MTREEKIKDFEDSVMSMYFDKNSLNSPEYINKFFSGKWNDIRRDEDTLALGTYVTKRNKEGKALEIYSPLVSSLVLLDYEKIDPLIYQTLINVIYNSTSICRLVNPFLSEYNYTFLISTLYNDNLVLTENQKQFLLNEVFSVNIEIRALFHKLKALDTRLGYDITLIKDCIQSIKDKIKVAEKNPHLLSKPYDIRYFISHHDMFEDLDKNQKWREFYEVFFLTRNFLLYPNSIDVRDFNNLFIESQRQDCVNLSNLLEDSIESVKIRKLARIPFL